MSDYANLYVVFVKKKKNKNKNTKNNIFLFLLFLIKFHDQSHRREMG